MLLSGRSEEEVHAWLERKEPDLEGLVPEDDDHGPNHVASFLGAIAYEYLDKAPFSLTELKNSINARQSALPEALTSTALILDWFERCIILRAHSEPGRLIFWSHPDLFKLVKKYVKNNISGSMGKEICNRLSSLIYPGGPSYLCWAEILGSLLTDFADDEQRAILIDVFAEEWSDGETQSIRKGLSKRIQCGKAFINAPQYCQCNETVKGQVMENFACWEEFLGTPIVAIPFSDPSEFKDEDRHSLYSILVARLNIQECNALALFIDINPESIAGRSTIEGYVQDLIFYSQKRAKIGKMLGMLAKFRVDLMESDDFRLLAYKYAFPPIT